MNRSIRPWLLALVFAGASVAGTPAAAQYTAFGKNKVQYSDFDWHVLESEHFHLYHYAEERELAVQALEMAEAAYDELRIRFVHEIKRPIPLIVYSSHADFEQTNITPYFLPEGVAGLTEFAKGRVLVPFDGNLHNFRTTIQHELVHVFQLSITGRVYREHFRGTPITPPLWFTEGLAVHWSEESDPEADMVLRDMVISGNLPAIDEFWRYDGSYATYKLGQSVLDFIGETWGDDRVRLFYERLWAWQRFEDVIEEVLGISQAELSQRWAHHMKQKYFPSVATAQPVSFESELVAAKGGANFKPLPLPPIEGYPHHFVFLSPRNGFTNVYTASLEGREEEVETLIAGERRPEFESFHAYRSRMDVSDEGLLLFVSKHHERDEIVVYSIPRREVVERYGFKELVGLTSPGWAGGTRRFVFSGLSKDGYSDIYLYDRDSESLRRLTSDRYQDLDPSWCSWKDAVVWSSDRTAWGEEGARNLFLLDLETGETRHLTRGDWTDGAPVCDPESKGIFFVSDRSGFFDVYWVDENGDGRRLTQSLEALLDPRPIPGKRAFVAAAYTGGRFQVRRFEMPDSSGPAVALAPADTTRPWDWREVAPDVPAKLASYETKFTLDVAQGGVMVDPGMRSGEGMQAVFSDMMGNHLLFVGLGNTSFSTTEFLRNFSASVSYVNLTRRLNYGLSAFQYAGDFYDELGFPYYERRAGAGALLRYPLSKFERIETNLSVAYSETDRPSTGFRRIAPVGAHSVSFIRDNSLWLPTGPIDGQRLNLTAGVTVNLREGSLENTMLLGDLRRYLRLGLQSAYALRVQGRWSEGENPEIFLLGGSHSLRTWDRRALHGRRSLLVNNEVRFPLVRGMLLGLPIGNLELPGIQGAVFLDGGTAWNEGWPPPRWYGAYGVGFRMGFGGFLVLRLDVGRRTDFETGAGRTHTDFYIGWNY